MKGPDKRVCIFCGSSEGARPSYAAAATGLVDELAQRSYGIVYGGGQIGLMGAVAARALDHGLELIGVIPKTLTQKEDAVEGASRLYVVDSMHERKALMNELSDAFIALPGGFGTMEELFEIITWGMLGLHSKPFGLLDVDGFFTPLLSFLDHASAEGFIPRPYRDMVRADADATRLLDMLGSWDPPDPVVWIDVDET